MSKDRLYEHYGGWNPVAKGIPPQSTNILEEAQEQVYGEKEKRYGHPLTNMHRIAKLWSDILGTCITPKQVALCFIASKIARELNAHSRNNLVDIAGYAAVLERLDE